MNTDTEYFYTVALERELNDLLEGREAGSSVKWKPSVSPPLTAGSTGVVWKRRQAEGQVLPVVLVVQRDDLRRLCGRFAQLRSDLSPLTAWCHLLSPRELETLDSLDRKPNLGGLEAAWTGLIVAEAKLLASLPIAKLRIAVCLATQSFSVARATAIWAHALPNSVIEKYDAANKLIRGNVPDRTDFLAGGLLRSTLFPIWNLLAALSKSGVTYTKPELEPIAASLKALLDARNHRDSVSNEAACFARPLMGSVPEAREFVTLERLTPEQRLALFDNLINHLISINQSQDQLRRIALPLVLGYLATIAAGGKPSLGLAEKHSRRWPEIMAWAYVVGSLGESVLWTSSFDGLGRLVTRELIRSFRLNDPPTCDFALDEGSVLIDPELSDPLVHLRIKQARIVTIALMPGVNIPVSVGESPGIGLRDRTPQSRKGPERKLDDTRPGLMTQLADALWPYIRGRVEEVSERATSKSVPDTAQKQGRQSGKAKQKQGSAKQLPLKK